MIEDPATFVFSARTDRRPVRRKAADPVRVLTYVFLGVALLALAFMVRDLVARSRSAHPPVATAGSIAHIEVPAAAESVVIDRTPKVFRCVSRQGAVSFQSQPCGPDARTTAMLDAQPDSPGEIARARQRQRASAQAAARMARIAGTDGGQVGYHVTGTDDRDARRARCASAQARRDATLRAVGLNRTYELLQQLDATVYEACKGL